MSLLPVVLSGGSGTRLWPYSREAYPKQFHCLVGEETLLQQTLLRLNGLEQEHPHQAIGLLPPLIIANEQHRFIVAEQMRQIGVTPQGILLEPVGRNTAPALTLAALFTRGSGDDPVLLVLAADHLVRDETAFRAALAAGYEQAAQGRLVTFGILPDAPETGYGYIHRGQPLAAEHGQAFGLQGFAEKPDQATAQGYIDTGEYYWNSGSFMMRASVWLEMIGRFRPDILAACERSLPDDCERREFCPLKPDAFGACPSDSIDYAVMERLTGDLADLAVVVPMAAGWSDVGAWSSLWQVREKNADANVLDGDVFVHDGSGNLLLAQHRMLAAVGVSDLVVVETQDAVLVMDKSRAQDVKAVTEYLKREQRLECHSHRRVHRPWGEFEPVVEGHRFQVKKIRVKPGASLSLQMHHHRAEHWVVVSGTARVSRGDETFLLTENESTFIPLGVQHRLQNPGSIPLEIIEVQSGSYLGEDDIVRFEDVYDRAENT